MSDEIVICKHNQTGFCKYLHQSTKEHVNKIGKDNFRCKDLTYKKRQGFPYLTVLTVMQAVNQKSILVQSGLFSPLLSRVPWMFEGWQGLCNSNHGTQINN